MRVRPIEIRRRLAPLDEAERRRHKLRNVVHSILLLGGIVALLALCGWVLFGPEGLVGMALGAAIALAFSPTISPGMVLRLYRAREIAPHDLPEVLHVLAALAERAGLERRPRLYYVPSVMLNAFAVGGRDDAVIAVTDGMLRALNLRELSGVLAHEISHIRNRDLWLMGIADVAGRLTRLMTLLGLVLLIINLPLWLSGAAAIPWLVVPLLVFAPQITILLQLALSRARELDADLDAAGLTGDPSGLAAALAKLERYRRGAWEQILLPGRRLPEPSVLRTHPPTAERIARLEALSGAPPLAPLPGRGGARRIEAAWPIVQGAPHGRLIGFWY
ncbi:MAG: zinc metalloprotease HtpX [Geminicoccaceae bacterium]